MPWVSRHRRRVPHSWFRTTTVQAHHRRSPATIPTVIAVVLAVALLLVLIF
ncbi:putative membrane protein [Saccharothrix espanaensis DSM 44229]|uniref:Putative membrane protein n=1 Tax=Saccharothrix espanaensis (strain ATCC 51144 / DSM 44229 / JCM 9112 / NBRC 15066 / NRRL 15764) TaxID=1179773 RepID=K0K743_SACES|nr:putative membrane protein [Saccharothrix espanaensis DSM 44229]